MAAQINSAIKTKVNHQVKTQANAEVTRGAVLVMNSVGAVIGLWAFACLVGAMVETGGPIALARAWFSAVTGM